MNTTVIDRIGSLRSKRTMTSDAVRQNGPLSASMVKSLCETCSLIYCKLLLHMRRVMKDRGTVLAQCRGIDLKANLACPMCCLLSSLEVENASENVGPREVDIVAYSSQRSYPQGYYCKGRKRADETVVICVVPRQGSISSSRSGSRFGSQVGLKSGSRFGLKSGSRTRDQHFPRANGFLSIPSKHSRAGFEPTPLGQRVNFEILRGWLEACRHLHGNHVDKRDRNPIANPEMLRLIECDTGNIILASPSDQYVALSYVWGNTSVENDVHNADNVPSRLPENPPNTISDAIEVTLQLGLKYLWVDKYCILQDDEADKRHQVSRMDAIYRNAEITILATAGHHSDYGLPGVKSRLRNPIQGLKLAAYPITITPPHPDREVRRSKWNTRGWVYQEAVLSRRRLVFTDREVYFECNIMQCREAIDTQLTQFRPWQVKKEKNAQSVFPPLGQKADDILQHISDYSKREFGRSDDIINGIIGIMRAFANTFSSENSDWQVPCAFWGIPILPSDSSGGYSRLIKYFQDHDSNKWTLALLLGMQWRSLEPSLRRPGFPSWSWTGWMGSVEWIGENERSHEIPDSDVKISVLRHAAAADQGKEQTVDFNTIMPSLQDPSTGGSCLQVEAWIVPLRLEYLPEGPPQNWHWGSTFNRGPGWYVKRNDRATSYTPAFLSIEVEPDSDLFKRLHTETWDSVVIGYDDLRDKQRNLPTTLICDWREKDGDIVAKRIGIAHLSKGTGAPGYRNAPSEEFQLKKVWRKFRLI